MQREDCVYEVHKYMDNSRRKPTNSDVVLLILKINKLK